MDNLDLPIPQQFCSESFTTEEEIPGEGNIHYQYSKLMEVEDNTNQGKSDDVTVFEPVPGKLTVANQLRIINKLVNSLFKKMNPRIANELIAPQQLQLDRDRDTLYSFINEQLNKLNINNKAALNELDENQNVSTISTSLRSIIQNTHQQKIAFVDEKNKTNMLILKQGAIHASVAYPLYLYETDYDDNHILLPQLNTIEEHIQLLIISFRVLKKMQKADVIQYLKNPKTKVSVSHFFEDQQALTQLVTKIRYMYIFISNENKHLFSMALIELAKAIEWILELQPVDTTHTSKLKPNIRRKDLETFCVIMLRVALTDLYADISDTLIFGLEPTPGDLHIGQIYTENFRKSIETNEYPLFNKLIGTHKDKMKGSRNVQLQIQYHLNMAMISLKNNDQSDAIFQFKNACNFKADEFFHPRAFLVLSELKILCISKCAFSLGLELSLFFHQYLLKTPHPSQLANMYEQQLKDTIDTIKLFKTEAKEQLQSYLSQLPFEIAFAKSSQSTPQEKDAEYKMVASLSLVKFPIDRSKLSKKLKKSTLLSSFVFMAENKILSINLSLTSSPEELFQALKSFGEWLETIPPEQLNKDAKPIIPQLETEVKQISPSPLQSKPIEIQESASPKAPSNNSTPTVSPQESGLPVTIPLPDSPNPCFQSKQKKPSKWCQPTKSKGPSSIPKQPTHEITKTTSLTASSLGAKIPGDPVLTPIYLTKVAADKKKTDIYAFLDPNLKTDQTIQEKFATLFTNEGSVALGKSSYNQQGFKLKQAPTKKDPYCDLRAKVLGKQGNKRVFYSKIYSVPKHLSPSYHGPTKPDEVNLIYCVNRLKNK